MMSVVKALKCNYPILRPTAWYWNSFVVGLGFLFQLWILYNTLHWSHLKDNRKKRQTCKTTNEFHFKVSDKLQPVERLFLWQYGVLKLEFVTSLFVLSTGEPKLFLFFFPSFSQDEWHLSHKNEFSTDQRQSILVWSWKLWRWGLTTVQFLTLMRYQNNVIKREGCSINHIIFISTIQKDQLVIS